jgi:hypothetical protein
MAFHPGPGEFDVVSNKRPTFARFMSKNSAADTHFLDVAPATSIADPAAPNGCDATAEATGEHASSAPNAVWQPRIDATHLSKGGNGIWSLRLVPPEHVRALHECVHMWPEGPETGRNRPSNGPREAEIAAIRHRMHQLTLRRVLCRRSLGGCLQDRQQPSICSPLIQWCIARRRRAERADLEALSLSCSDPAQDLQQPCAEPVPQ